ncbi:MAG TPA: plastocyanin/azurin family copper-binding protein [Terriglobales bacterium]|nr:plastocyanin/azurin family copper-binding protein [Terriglobales bacterium]
MKVYLGVLAVLIAMLAPQFSPAQTKTSDQPLKTFSGCLTSANGRLLLQDSGGHAYALHGHTGEMSKHLDHMVQVRGTPEKPENPHKIGAALRVKSWKVGGECHLDLSSLSRQSRAWRKSSEPGVAVAGKVGQEAIAVPVTSNRSVGETTPPSDVDRSRITPHPTQPGQPPVAEDLAQNPAAANRIAIAAQRAEIGTHNGTLGVPADAGSGTLASQQLRVRPAVVVRMDGEEFEPAKVTIAAGQTVKWKNNSGDPHTVTIAPDKALLPADVALPPKAQPFDSGTIPAGMTFAHTFTVPGTYRYYCTLHEGNGMVGEVIVK